MLRTSQIVAGILLIPYMACGAVLCLLVLDRRYCNSPHYLLSNTVGGTFTPLAITTSTKSTIPKSSKMPTSTRRPSTKSTPRKSSTPTPKSFTKSPKSSTRPPKSSTSFTTAKPSTSSRSSTKSTSFTSPISTTSSVLSTSPTDTKSTTTTGIYGPETPEMTSSPLTTEQSFEDGFCAGGYHGLWSLMGTLMMGFSVVIFRLLSGTRIRIVKYVHLSLHVITLILFGIGLWCIFTNEYSITSDRINYHGLTSWVVLGIFCVQFVMGITKFRHHIAFFHDLVGVWIFISCVSCCISGKRKAQLDYVGINQELFYGLSYVCFTCILIVTLSPFFEWDMLGPL